MKSKISSLLLVLMIVCFGALFFNRAVNFKKNYSDVELIYENDNTNRYYYESLSENAKIAYTLILPRLYEHSEKIEIPKISDEEFDSLIYALSYDNPDLFCIAGKSRLKSENNIYYYYPTYTHSENECQSKKTELENAVNEALSGINTNASEYEKELYVHDLICNICKYEISGNNLNNSSAYDVLITGNAVCEGYAKAAKLLLDKLGVSNYLVTGEAADENGKINSHMWNIVNINGENYHLDVTWDDMDTDELFTNNHIYFNVTDEMISKTHFNIKPSINNCNSTDFNYYNMNGMYFNRYDETARKSIMNEIYKNYKNGNDICEFCFSNENDYNLALKSLIQEDGLSDLLAQAEQIYGKTDYSNIKYITDENSYVFEFIFF